MKAKKGLLVFSLVLIITAAFLAFVTVGHDILAVFLAGAAGIIILFTLLNLLAV